MLIAEIWAVRDGETIRIWDEEVPMQWTHHGEPEKTIGADGDADLCMVEELGSFRPGGTRVPGAAL